MSGKGAKTVPTSGPGRLGKALGEYRVPILLFFGLIAFILGCIGLIKQARYLGFDRSLLDAVYMAFSLFKFSGGNDIAPGNWELEIARWLAPGVALLAIIEFIRSLLEEEIRMFRLKFARWHVIVCGLGYLGPEIVTKFRERGIPVVVIEKNPESPNVAACLKKGAIVLIGDATDHDILKRARLARAWYLFAVTGDDGQNSEIAVAARQLAEARGAGGFTCFVHIVDGGLCTLLRDHQIMVDNDRFTLELFNIYQMAGLAVLKDHPAFPLQETPPDAHVLVIGAGKMGQDMIFHVARQWRESYGDAKKIKITVVDCQAGERVESLKVRYPSISRYCDLVPLPIDIDSVGFQQGRFLFDGDRVAVTAAYVCLNDQSQGLAAALEMSQHIDNFAIGHHVSRPEVPIVVRTGKDGLKSLFDDMKAAGRSFRYLSSFPLIDRTCSVDNITGGLNETIAMAIHEDYVRNQRRIGVTPAINPSTKPWEKLDQTLKESNRNQAVHIREKLRTIGCEIVRLTDWEEELFQFRDDEVEKLAIMEHDRFVGERERQGWKYGPEKDVEKKITPYLVPYDRLTKEIKDLDRNAVRALPLALVQADLKIVRLPGAPGNRETVPVPKIPV
jgi:hypothetical protein